MEDDIDELAQMIQSAGRAVVFTGAGVSTECGIPDFRSPGGFWTRYKPIEFDDFLASEETRLEAWRRYFNIYDAVAQAVPGPSHKVIAGLYHAGIVSHVITQNIDDLHRASGVPEEAIIELHGNGSYAKCLSCGERYEIAWARAQIEAGRRPPYCSTCAGIVKTATISFGQAMPEAEMARARAATFDADLFLALGSSLQVFPAASFPVMAKSNRARLVIINREPTGLDALADLVIAGELGDVLSATAERLGRQQIAC
ncbi:NAD-dependent deacetylase [Nordella sp. HKS 07]|uniref:SIR2 family NAD-dependent protein deacylase n=1 Tax=Nordella sp. HKS 07 TaxID=2712222 RepID=UPI0013E1C824|nr:Sir2 family NAD-dependent protein deacetylase [Nordella sp. HKS 07]QIG50979.1 NAD-dependent deacetylase [Nordella sp. HKS 07]